MRTCRKEAKTEKKKGESLDKTEQFISSIPTEELSQSIRVFEAESRVLTKYRGNLRKASYDPS